MSDAIIKTNDRFEFLTGEERLYFLMNSSDVNLELVPENKSKLIQNHKRQLNVFKKKYMNCNFLRKTYNKTTKMLAVLKRLDNGFQ